MRVKKSTIKKLSEFYFRNGYVRWQDQDKLKKKGHRRYRKGDELRLVARTKTELREIRRLLREAGFKYGKPYDKGRQYCQPVYGYDQVDRFLEMVGE